MSNIFREAEIFRETIDDWFTALDRSGNHNNFTYSVEYWWKTKKTLTEKQIRALLPFVWSAYKILGNEEDWNTAWDNF